MYLRGSERRAWPGPGNAARGGGDGELRVDQVLGAREDFRQWGLRGGGVPGWVPCSS